MSNLSEGRDVRLGRGCPTGCRRSRVVTFTAIRLRGPEFKPRPGQKFENEIFQAHPSGGEGVSPMQGEVN